MSLEEMIGDKGKFKIVFMFNYINTVYEDVGVVRFKDLYQKATSLSNEDITILVETGKNENGKTTWYGFDI